MKVETKQRKKAMGGFKQMTGSELAEQSLYRIMTEGKRALDDVFLTMGRMLAESVMLIERIIFITDGGSGVIKSLHDRFGKKLLHQRCAIHKSRNLQKHLAKKYRKEAHRLLMNALEQNHYEDAKAMLKDLEKWLRVKNESAADSLLEAFEELLTMHRLKVPKLLRKSLITTNPIESMFSLVRQCEKNIKRPRDSKMLQRWLGYVLLYCEKQFHKVAGYQEIEQVIVNIDLEFADEIFQKAA